MVLTGTVYISVPTVEVVNTGTVYSVYYTFFLSGRKKEERHEVGFAIKSHIASQLLGLPKGINDRLITLRLPLLDKGHATIVSTYAPPMTNPDEVKDKFYDDLDSMISAAPRTDKLILLGDINATVGTDYHTWEGVIRSEGVGKCNSNGSVQSMKY